jgi:Leucine-rich repeat (LRR) protein
LDKIEEDLYHILYKSVSLNLSNNKYNFTTIKKKDQRAKNVYLNLSNNGLDYIGFLFDKLLSYNADPFNPMTTLDLSRNRFETLNFSLEFLTALQDLHLQENRITYLKENTFSELSKLLKLDISQNKLIFIEKYTFMSLPVLEHLNMSCNLIKLINIDQFSSLVNLIELDMSYNSIEYFHPHTFLNLRSLKNLYFQMNSVRSIEKLIGLASIRNIHLDLNLLLENTSAVNLEESIHVKFYKKSLDINYLISVNIITYPQNSTFNYLDKYCATLLFLIKNKISLNLITEEDFDSFFTSCRIYSAKNMFVASVLKWNQISSKYLK